MQWILALLTLVLTTMRVPQCQVRRLLFEIYLLFSGTVPKGMFVPQAGLLDGQEKNKLNYKQKYEISNGTLHSPPPSCIQCSAIRNKFWLNDNTPNEATRHTGATRPLKANSRA